jgi:GntR family transcriptional regulator
MPLWFQLARILEEEITTGRWPVGHQIDSEPALGDHFQLSRGVIRQALDRLERDGLVRRVKGRGTFVAGSVSHSWRLHSSDGLFREEVTRLGRSVTSQILRAELAELPGWAALALGLKEGAEGVMIARLRSIDGELAVYTVNYLPGDVADTVLALSPDDSLYEQIERRNGRTIHSGRRVLEAVSAERDLAKLLAVPRGAPLIFIESVSWDAQMRPFDCFQTWVRTDRMRLEIQIAPSEAGGQIGELDGTLLRAT